MPGKTGDSSAELVCPHGDLLFRKAKERVQLRPCLAKYNELVTKIVGLTIRDEESVLRLVKHFNDYRDAVLYTYEDEPNSPQANLRSNLLEEFMVWLFKDLVRELAGPNTINCSFGKTSSTYLNLTFAPRSFGECFAHPGACVGFKNQDFAIGPTISIAVQGTDNSREKFENVVLPVVAIECKCYLAKNHLDMCASTAADIKKAMPYCRYCVVAEFIKMEPGISPEYTDISEIYVLCKAENKERKERRKAGLPPHPIHSDVAWSLYSSTKKHLSAIWWDPEEALATGRIIRRPS